MDYKAQELSLSRSPSESEKAALAEVELRLPNPSKPLIMIEARVNDRGPFRFAVDTGTSTSVVSPELARELSLPSVPVAPVTTGGAQINVAAARLRSLTVENAGLQDLDVIVGDFLSMLSDVVGTELDGIIGFNYLRAFRVVIDYPEGIFRLE